MDIKTIIDNIPLPFGSHYYEHISADGFAFLGYARHKVGLDCDFCYNKIRELNFTIQGRVKTGIFKSTPNNMYVYTIWACIEFLREISKIEDISYLMTIIDKIGIYPNGMMRYCLDEIDYIVPNVTSAASLLYVWNNQIDKSKELLSVFLNRQTKGNWTYFIPSTRTIGQGEDSYHLAMIVYHLKEIQKLLHIDLSTYILSSLEVLKYLNRRKKKLQLGSVGWGVPMLYVACKGLDKTLEKVTLDYVLRESINHPNFRTRAIAAWSLAKCLE